LAFVFFLLKEKKYLIQNFKKIMIVINHDYDIISVWLSLKIV